MAIIHFSETSAAYWQRIVLRQSMVKAQLAFPRFWYGMLEAYYFNNALYDDVQTALMESAIWTPGMKSLRNPVNRAVEFHVSKLWPGALPKALPIVAKNKNLPAEVEKIWAWSNFATQKQVVARQLAGLGDAFIKVAEKVEDGKVVRVYLDPIRPMNVTELELDERGFVIEIRIDVPSGNTTHTEVWSKTWGGVRVWEHEKGLDQELSILGTPTKQITFEELQFDFIPIVHSKFRDIGQVRGSAAFVHALDKIDEVNRQTTRLHQMIFRYNKPTIALLANDVDSAGRPLPPPVVTGSDSSDSPVNLHDDDVWPMPGRSKIEYLVPNLNYADALSIVASQMEEITKDLPEVLYYELANKDNMSGVALRTLLGSAIDRVIEARGNAEPALARADEMALTIASIHDLIKDIGTFEAGDFVHTFAERDVIAISNTERAEILKTETESGIPLPIAMEHNGFSEEEIAKVSESQEYKIFLLGKVMEVVKSANEAKVPIETVLLGVGWTEEMLKNMGTQRMAQILSEQEDVISDITQ